MRDPLSRGHTTCHGFTATDSWSSRDTESTFHKSPDCVVYYNKTICDKFMSVLLAQYTIVKS